jgi:hypothetical protein
LAGQVLLKITGDRLSSTGEPRPITVSAKQFDPEDGRGFEDRSDPDGRDYRCLIGTPRHCQLFALTRSIPGTAPMTTVAPMVSGALQWARLIQRRARQGSATMSSRANSCAGVPSADAQNDSQITVR